MIDQISIYLPNGLQLSGLAATLGVAMALTILGAAAGGPRRLAEADLVSGWALVTFAFTLIGTASPLPFTWIAGGVAVATIVACGWLLKKGDPIFALGSMKMILLVAPLLVIVAAMTPSQWDEFSHWLWGPQYLLEVDGFPSSTRPLNPATFPAYPYAMPLVSYLAGRVAGFFAENAGAVFNVTLVAVLGLLLVRQIEDGLSNGPIGRARPGLRGFGMAGVGLIAASLLNPTFVKKLAFTGYADVATALAVCVAGVAGWRMIQAIADNDPRRAKALAWQAGLALMLLALLKQGNLALIGLIPIGIAVAGLRHPDVPKARLGRNLITVLAPAVAAHLIWGWYAGRELPGASLSIMAFSDWAIATIPQTLASMGSVIAKKGHYFLPALIVGVFGIRALIRHRGPFHDLALIFATVFFGYNAFLFVAYIIVFGGYEAESAASFWRYNTHMGALLMAAVCFGLARAWAARLGNQLRPWLKPAGWAAALLILVIPVAIIPKIRFDIHAPKQYVRMVGHDLKERLPEGAKLAIIDPLDAGFFALQIRYDLYPKAEVVMKFNAFNTGLGAERTKQLVGESGATHAWIHTQDALVREVFGLPLPSGASYLLVRKEAGGWEQLAAWDYPGYALPTDIPD